MLRDIPAARLFDEVLKLFLAGYAEYTFDLLLEHDLFAQLFPASGEALKRNPEYTEKPVSYTHLDVYKRQVLMQARRPCGVSLISQLPGSLRLGSLLRLNQTRQPSLMQLSIEPVLAQWMVICSPLAVSISARKRL